MDLNSIEQQLPEDVKKALPYLMVGGGGALLGGLATGRRHKHDGESRLGYAGRVAKNMALAGALAGGGSYALGKGSGLIRDSIDTKNLRTGSDPDANPVASLMRDVAFSPLTAGLAGVGTLSAVKGGLGKELEAARTALKDKGMFKTHFDPMKAFDDAKRSEINAGVKDIIAQNPGDKTLLRTLSSAGVPTYEGRVAAGGESAPWVHKLKSLLGKDTTTSLAGGSPAGVDGVGIGGLERRTNVGMHVGGGREWKLGKNSPDLFESINAHGEPGVAAGESIGGVLNRSVPTSFGNAEAVRGVDIGTPLWRRALEPVRRAAKPAVDFATNPRADAAVGRAERLLRRWPGRLVGQTPGRIAGRLALGGAAALAPSLLGSILTDPVQQ